MIAPNLATMLSFIFTNADINSNLLKTIKKAVANSFNAITVVVINQLMIWFLFFIKSSKNWSEFIFKR